MSKKTRTAARLLALPVASVIALTGLTACAGAGGADVTNTEAPSGSGGFSMTRHKIYDSLQGLADDATTVVVGTATGVRIEPAQYGDKGEMLQPPVSVARVRVDGPVRSTTRALVGLPQETLRSSQVVDVKQMGASGTSETPAPMIVTGSRYVLFLSDVGDGRSYSRPTFWVTGGPAGIYAAAPSDKTLAGVSSTQQAFTLPTALPDKLPGTLVLDGTTLTAAR